MRLFIGITVLLLMMMNTAHAKKLHHERWYQDFQCNALKGHSEFRPAKDRWVRIDCELPNYSVEVDFASGKQYEAVGQALYYSLLTGKKAGIWLIVEKHSDMKHAVRMVRNIRGNNLNITVWLQRYRLNKTPKFELYYQPVVVKKNDKFTKIMEYGKQLEAQ